MKITLFLLILALLSILTASCTKELRYTKEKLFAIAKKGDPNISFILPRSMNDGIQCSDYPPGCLAGHIVKVRGLELIAVEFMHENEAKDAAIKVRGYYIRNWLLDDVTGEPILERFVQDTLKAKKP